jgi:hypothetical protein
MPTKIERKKGVLEIIRGNVTKRKQRIHIADASIILATNEAGTGIVNVSDSQEGTYVSGTVYLNLTNGQGCDVDGYRIVRL